MAGEPLRQTVVIHNPHGFHVRPAAAFAEAANRYHSEVTLQRGDLRVNGRRIMDLIMLAAEQGTELILEVSGPDQDQALATLAEIIEAVEPSPVPRKG